MTMPTISTMPKAIHIPVRFFNHTSAYSKLPKSAKRTRSAARRARTASRGRGRHYEMNDITNSQTDDVNSRDGYVKSTPTESPRRFPLLGLTRQDAELFFKEGKKMKKSAEPKPDRHNRARSAVSTHSSASGLVSRPFVTSDPNHEDVDPSSDPESSEISTDRYDPHPRVTVTFTKHAPQEVGDTKAPSTQSETQARSSLTSTNTTSQEATKPPTGKFQKNVSGVKVEHYQDAGLNEPVYCVISSANPRKSANHLKRSGVNTSQRVKDILKSRNNLSYVLTADTASLLLQSGPPLVIRSVTEFPNPRGKTSAIQQVSEANVSPTKSAGSSGYNRRSRPGLPVDKNNNYKSHSTSSSRENSGLRRSAGSVRSGSAGRRGGHENTRNNNTEQYYPSRSRNNESKNRLHRSATDVTTATSANTNSLLRSQQFSSEDAIRNGRSPSLQRSKTESYPNHARSASLQRSKQESQLSYSSKTTSTSLPRAPSNGLVRASTHISKTSTHESNSDFSMAYRNMTKKFTSESSKNIKDKKGSKTLTPSKHGFHPRSNSPTFKRLVAASERLNELFVVEESLASPSVHDPDYDRYRYDSDSSDSGRGMRVFTQKVLDGYADSENLTSDSSRSNDAAQRNAKCKGLSSQGHQRSPPRTHRSYKVDMERREPQNGRGRSRLPPSKRHLAKDKHAPTMNGKLDNSTEDLSNILNYPILESTYDIHSGKPSVEVETRCRNGQPTHLHFFLPQLAADGMSDVSGTSLTSRSFYQEQRLELLNRTEQPSIREESVTHSRSSHNLNHADLNGSQGLSKPKTQPNTHEHDSSGKPGFSRHRSSTNAHQSNHDRGGRNASKDRVTARDIRHGHLTLNVAGHHSPSKEDAVKNKQRHASPMRNAGSRPDKTGGGKRRTSQGFVRQEYIESTLPSEKLKKQLDDFPTLVSMEYKEPDTSLQVR